MAIETCLGQIEPFRVLAWGCGLQSTTLAAMSTLGELEPLDLVLHCDLHWERGETLRSRDRWAEWLLNRRQQVEILDVGDVREKGSEEHIYLPFWTPAGGHLRRQCTRAMKVRPMRRHIRQALGYPASVPPAPQAGAVKLWIGFSLDEYDRAFDDNVQYMRNRYPLIERGMTRTDCARWLREHDLGALVPGKSACVGCPFRQASEWLDMRETAPCEFDEAVAFDEMIRDHPLDRVTSEQLYLYKVLDLDARRRSPLKDADLERDAQRERQARQLPLFWEEATCSRILTTSAT